MAKSSKATATKKRKACTCIRLVNKELAAQNCRLVTGLSIDFSTGEASCDLRLPLEKIDKAKRGSLPSLVPTYCPFCGKKTNVK